MKLGGGHMPPVPPPPLVPTPNAVPSQSMPFSPATCEPVPMICLHPSQPRRCSSTEDRHSCQCLPSQIPAGRGRGRGRGGGELRREEEREEGVLRREEEREGES